MKDLWGNEIVIREPGPIIKTKRTATKPNGYAAPPGTGPKGETCKSCFYYAIKRLGKSYRKCGLVYKQWTGGPGTDILARSPACHFWKKQENE